MGRTSVKETKNGSRVQATMVGDNPVKGKVASKYMGTPADQLDMTLLGKEQVLRVSICLCGGIDNI